MKFLAYLDKQTTSFKLQLGFTLVAAIGVVDVLTGSDLALSLIYVIPIFLVTWSTGRKAGLAASIAATLVSFGAEWLSRTGPYMPLWNALIRLSFFVFLTIILAMLRAALERQRNLARTDTLTGVVNSRWFHDLAQMEIDRFQRYQRSFSVAYIDLDNFKTLNDQFGHAAGDSALCIVAGFIRDHTRRTDVVARIGGDEFALLLPETNEERARVVISKIQAGLTEQMRQHGWPITFSIGVLTCRDAPPTSDALIRMADQLMYAVKNDGKNAANYSTYPAAEH